jgi:DNA-binding SARP family transcriptional activator
MTASTRLFLFGGFRIEGDEGRQVPLTGKRGAAVIAYLARCPGMAASRERLADLLWSESDSERAHNSLRHSASCAAT